MKLLILSQHYWPESFRINEVALSLRQAGAEVAVLTGQPNYPDGRVFEGYRAGGIGRTVHPAGYDIYRVPLIPRGRGGALRLVLNYLSFLSSASVLGPWLLRGRRLDIVFVYGTSPILQAIAAILIARLKTCRVVTWVQDLWPQSLEVTGFVRNRHLLAATAWVVRWIYRHSDLLLVQSRAAMAPVQALAGGTPVEYHPNPGELAFGAPAPPVTDAALKLGPGFNVVFAGNLGTVQSLETILDAAEVLRPHGDVRIVLIGSGSRSEWLAQESRRRALANVEIAGRFDPNQMPAILAQASALLVTLSRAPALSQIVPSKVQAYLAAGRPIIASLDGEGARVVEESGAGIACPAEDAPSLAQAILALRSATSTQREAMGAAGRRYYEEHFDPTTLARRLMLRFASLAAGAPERIA